MEAVEYLRTKNRMTKKCGIRCDDCPLDFRNNGKGVSCGKLTDEYPEVAVSIVERWSKENPAKTRQSELLKVLPNASQFLDGIGILSICPTSVDKEFRCNRNNMNCYNCRKKYWLEEIKEDER